MARREQAWKWGLAVTLLFAGAGIFYCVREATGPDRDLHFHREVPSEIDAKTLGLSIHALGNWPKWYFSLEKAEAMDLAGRPLPLKDQYVNAGSVIRLTIDPQKGPWRKFEIWVRILEYTENQHLRMAVLKDSKGKLTALFSAIEWQLDLETKPNGGTLIVGTATARTAHWRSRLLGAIAGRIVMNQVYYPDLIELAQLKQPRAVDPFLPNQH